ncbi:carbohydrate porin [Shewanella avicenniae]|uniref:Carbohydrate porin n=1 Tax=Shewanella avicenniae TaxID=2814294 RepID=A0ABX7QL74_9GAMM|nr:carbohydrate porin [Shewanella avicenniae]QSX32204.1 carbohydrate porin [Shewanella avicenniae]
MTPLLRTFYAASLSVMTSVCFADDTENGFVPFAAIVIDNSQVVSGGLERGFTSRFLVDGGFEFNHGQHFIFADLQLQRGDDGSAMTGDAQAYSNIDEADFTKLYQLNYYVSFSRGFLRVGRHDANEEFANTLASDGFINASMGFSPTIAALPTYPYPALTLHGGINISEQFELVGGVYASGSSSRFDEQFYIAELRTAITSSLLLKTGVWLDTNSVVDDTEQRVANSSHGVYSTLDTDVGKLSWLGGTQADHFIQLGYTHHHYSEIDFHAGMGIRLTELFGREDQNAGVGITAVRMRQQTGEFIGWESTLELYWQVMIHDQVMLQPDVQFIQHPSGVTDIDDAWVITLRIEVSAF